MLYLLFITGNSWGKCSNGTRGLGCGAQEEFRGCADVRIVKSRKSIPSKLDLNNVCKGLSKGMLSDQKLNCDKIYNLGDVTCKNDSCRSLVKQILNLGSQCDDLTATMTSLKRHCHNTECYAEVLSVEEYSNVTVQKEQSKFKEFFNVTGDELAVPSCEICNSPFSRYLNVYAVCKARNFELNPLENFTEDSLLCRQKLKSLCYEISVGKIRLEDLCVKNSSRIIGIHEFCIGSNVDFEICDLDNSIASQRFCHNNSNSIAYDFSNPCESNPVDGIDANKFGDLCETSFSTTTRQNITFNEFCKNSSPKRTIQNRICSKFADFSKVVVKTSKNIAKISKALINLCRDADSNGLEEYGQLCFSLLTQNVRLIDRIKVIHLNHSMASNVGTKNVTVPTESAMVKYRCKYGNNLGDESEALAGDNVICEMMTEPDSQNITGELRNRNSSLETSTIQKVKETDQYKQAYQNIFKLISAGGEDEVEYLHHGSSVHSEYNHIDNLTMELVDEISAEVATVNRIAQSSTTQPNKTSNINSTGNNEDRPTHERYKMENVLQSGAENSTSETNAIYNELLQPDDKTKAKLEHVRQSDNELELGKNNETRNALTQEMSAASTQVVDDQEGGNDSISHRSEQMKQEDKNEQDSTIGNATMGQTMSAGSNSIDEIEEGNPGMFSEPTEKKDMRGEESMENDNVIAEGVDVSRNCVPKGLWRVVPDMDLWCLHNCAPATPSSACLHHCQCSHSDSDILKGFSFT